MVGDNRTGSDTRNYLTEQYDQKRLKKNFHRFTVLLTNTMTLKKSSGKTLRQGNDYVKYYMEDFQLEKDKQASLHELSRNSHFIAPKPLIEDDHHRMIRFEGIDDIISIRNTYLELMKNEKCNLWQLERFYRIGIALGEIHEKLTLKSRQIWRPGKLFTRGITRLCLDDADFTFSPREQAFLHGDFGFSNIFFKKADNTTPIILDASFDGFTVFSSNTYGPVYLDIAHLATCLDGLVPLRHHLFMRWQKATKIKDSFFSGYEDCRGIQLDRNRIFCFSVATAYAKFAARGRLLGKPGVWLMYNRLKGNLPTGK